MLNRIICLSLLIFFFLPGAARADIITLKSGEVYSGEIILENDFFVRIDTLTGTDGRVKEFLPNKIKSIERGTMEATEVFKESASVVEAPVGIEPVPGETDIPATVPDGTLSPIPTAVESEPPPINAPEPVSSPPVIPKEESVPLDNEAIEEILRQSGAQQIGFEQIADDAQVAQMEAQVEEMMQPKNMAGMVFAALGALLLVSAVPLLICGVIGFFLAKKFDDVDTVVEVIGESAPEAEPKLDKMPVSGYPLHRTVFDPPPEPEREKTEAAGKEELPEKRGGLIRRFVARNVDLFLGVGTIMFFYSLPGLIVPLDKFAVTLMLVVMLPLMLVFFFYFFLGIGKLKNSYGRYLLDIKVVDKETGERPSLGQAFKRDFLLFLWPVDFFVLIFSKIKCRIGDRWAQTKVVVTRSPTPWFKRLVPGIMLGVVIFGFIHLASPLINDRMVISQAAKDYLGRQFGEDQITRPSHVAILNYKGRVNIKLKNGESYSVFLINSGEDWTVTRIQKIPEAFLGKGYSIQYGR